MLYPKIQTQIAIAILLLVTNCPKLFGQSKAIEEMMKLTYDMNDDSSRTYLNGNAIFIVINNRNCSKCFHDVCNYLKQQKDTSFKYYGLFLTEKNYLNLIPLQQRYQEEITCVNNFFFHFITPDQNKEISRICEMPTPQLIIKTGGKYKHVDYKSTLALIGD